MPGGTGSRIGHSHDQLRTHRAGLLAANNFARRLKTLGGLAPYEHICKSRTSEPDRFILNPVHQVPGLNIRTGFATPDSSLKPSGQFTHLLTRFLPESASLYMPPDAHTVPSRKVVDATDILMT